MDLTRNCLFMFGLLHDPGGDLAEDYAEVRPGFVRSSCSVVRKSTGRTIPIPAFFPITSFAGTSLNTMWGSPFQTRVHSEFLGLPDRFLRLGTCWPLRF